MDDGNKLRNISGLQQPDGAVSRREFMKAGATAGIAAASVSQTWRSAMAQSADEKVTPWGWPQPYRTVSEPSVAWLKKQGWWPLQVAWNPLWSDGNFVLFIMQRYKLLEKRGIEAQFPAFLTAGLMNEAFVPGKIQVAQAGSLGLLRLIDLRIPTVAVAVYPAQRQAFLVPPDSPLKSLADLKDQKILKRPAIVGVTIGSTNHLGFIIAAKVLNLTEGKDYDIKNVGPGDIVPMPKGFDVTAIWEPNVLQMTEFLKNARILELVDRYEVFNGYSYLKGELEKNAPDIIQAYVDAFVEARLIARVKTDEALAAFVEDPSQKGREPDLIRRDAQIYVLDPKPTVNYPFENTDGYWIPLEKFQSDVLYDARLVKRRYTDDDFKSVLRPSYLANTYERLGWAIPNRPAFLPADWAGTVGAPPYPPYGSMLLGKQAFPAPGDLTKPWTFGGKTYTP